MLRRGLRIMSVLNAYIGLPSKDRGRDRNGIDCWGLARLVYKECLGIELPDLANVYIAAGDRPTVRAAVASQREDWTPVLAGKPFDLVLIRQAPWHVGVVVRHGLMLHIPENGESCIEPYLSGRWGDRVEGVYRHHKMLEFTRRHDDEAIL